MTKVPEAFMEKVLHCQKDCPLWSCEPGRYPKFGYGNPESDLMAVLENPGSPDRDDANIELEKNIKNVTVEHMRQGANRGIMNWLEYRGLPSSLFNVGNQSLLEAFYITQAFRCPGPKRKPTDGAKEQARRTCLPYLVEGIGYVRPRAIVCIGRAALSSVYEALHGTKSPRLKVKELFLSGWEGNWRDIRILAIVHPDGFWKAPSIPKEEYVKHVRRYLQRPC